MISPLIVGLTLFVFIKFMMNFGTFIWWYAEEKVDYIERKKFGIFGERNFLGFGNMINRVVNTVLGSEFGVLS